MKKLAIVLDSFCGKDKKQVEAHEDFYFIPLKAIIDGKEYLDGVDLPHTKMLDLINKAKEVKTSQPAPATSVALIEDLSKKYETVIYLPIGSALSGTFQTAKMLANDFQNVYVLNNHLVGVEFIELGKHLIKLAQTKSEKEVIAFAESYIKESGPKYVIPRDVDAFIKGGRLGKAIAFVLEKLKAVPIISFEDEEKLHKKMVKRSGSSAIDYALDKLVPLAKEKGIKDFHICHTLDETFAKESKAKLEAQGFRVHYELTSSVINTHTGDGAHSIGFYKKLD